MKLKRTNTSEWSHKEKEIRHDQHNKIRTPYQNQKIVTKSKMREDKSTGPRRRTRLDYKITQQHTEIIYNGIDKMKIF